MARAQRLKVFQAPFGFHESVVAAPSRKAALEAWGSHQNLFALGQAREADDEAAIAAALAQPGVPLARPIGSKGEFSASPESPRIETLAPSRPAKKGAAARTSAAPPPPKRADRTGLSKAEDALARIEAHRNTAMARLERRRRDLDAEIDRVRNDFSARLDKAKAALAEAQRTYREAGGED